MKILRDWLIHKLGGATSEDIREMISPDSQVVIFNTHHVHIDNVYMPKRKKIVIIESLYVDVKNISFYTEATQVPA